MRNRRNYYRILHVQQDAPATLIKSCYRSLMRELDVHPDRGGDHWNAAVLNEAYAVLSDARKRAEYDRKLGTVHWRDAGSGTKPTDSPVPAEARESDPRQAAPSFCVFCGLPHDSHEVRCTRCASPLTLEQVSSRHSSGRRAVLRQALDRPVELFTEWPLGAPCRGRIRDLSPSGLRLELDRAVEHESIVRVDCDLLQASASVVRCRPRPDASLFDVGLELFTLRFARLSSVFLSVSG